MTKFANKFFSSTDKTYSGRIRTSYESNITAGLSLSGNGSFVARSNQSRSRFFYQPEETIKKRITACRENIIYHAANRVDLHFYSIIAFYQKNVEVKKGHTGEQHGFGFQKYDTVGCHPALIPNFFIQKKYSASEMIDFHETHLARSLNMTDELPSLVNVFDHHIEGYNGHSTIVINCLSQINKVSNENLDPIAAFNHFFQNMDDFFRGYPCFLRQVKSRHAESLLQICEYQRKGTFLAAENIKVKKEYLALMLGLKPDDKNLFKPDLLHQHYLKLQKEIWMNKTKIYRP